jgi:SAM-dependent methyltransferase
LLSAYGQDVLHEATAAYDAGPLQAASRLSSRHPADLVAAALTQVVLRQRAVKKFGNAAATMYFTPTGLEQATGTRVADHRAARIAAAAPAAVLDACCGVGGDLIALGSAGLTVAAVDRDPLHVSVARANMAVLGVSGAVQVADVTSMDLAPFGIVYADPSRRAARGRVFDVADYSPPWTFVSGLLRRPSGVKVAPGIPHDRVPVGVETEWVSLSGEVKEAVLWSPYLATVRRRATVIRGRGLATLTNEDDPGEAAVRPVSRWLFEPDGAVIRAGLVTAVAAAVGGGLVDEHIAYVTADAPASTPFARCFEVLDVLPYREKMLKAALRDRDIGAVTIKKRGVAVAPEDMRKRLALRGNQHATIVLTRAAGKGVALLVRPV